MNWCLAAPVIGPRMLDVRQVTKISFEIPITLSLLILPPQNLNLTVEPAAAPSTRPHDSNPIMLVIAIHPGAVANEGGYMNSVKDGHISGQQLVGIYNTKRRNILHDKSISGAAVFPKIFGLTVSMALRRADVLRAVQCPIVGAFQHDERFEIVARHWRGGDGQQRQDCRA